MQLQPSQLKKNILEIQEEYRDNRKYGEVTLINNSFQAVKITLVECGRGS